MGADLPTADRVIDGHRYEVTKMTMRSWYQLSSLVISMVGPTLAELLAGSRGNLMDMDLKALQMSPQSVGKALWQLCDGMSAENQEKLVTSMAKVTMVDGKPLDPDFWWPRNMAALVPWVTFAIGWQLADFFAGAQDCLPRRADADQGSQGGSESGG